MEAIIKYTFALFGLFVAVYLSYLDKSYPESKPTDNIVFWLIGWYIAFVFAWPTAVWKALERVSNKISGFNISFKKDE